MHAATHAPTHAPASLHTHIHASAHARIPAFSPAAAPALRRVAPEPPQPMPAVATRPAARPGALPEFREALLIEHLPLVRVVARSMAERLPAHVEMDELLSAGRLGLLDAARRFEAGRGVQFRSYAQFRIRGAILDSLRLLDWSPRELRRQGRALAEARHTAEVRLGRPADEAELAREMDLPLSTLQELTRRLRLLEVSTLNVERGEDHDEEELNFVPAGEAENPLCQLLEGESRQRVLAAVEALPERKRLVMRLYYFEEMTMREIGNVLGVVESRVSQIHQETLRRLRRPLACLRRPRVPAMRRVA